MSRRAKALTVLAAVAVVAAGCAGGQPGARDEANVQQVCAADEFGCVRYGAGDPIKLGTLLVISGTDATLGLDSQHGVALAIDELDGTLDGNNGKLLGHDVTLVNEDEQCSAEGGQAGATRLAADQTIVAVVGTSCSSAALGVADRILSEKGMLLISPSNTNPNLTAEGTHQDFYARTAHNDKIQGAVVANFAFDELRAKTAATINDESPYADALAAVFRENFERLGGTITAVEAVQSTDTDLKPTLTRIAEDRPDVLYYPNFIQVCSLTARQGRGIAGLAETNFIGSDGCASPDYGKIAGETANGTFLSSPDLSGFQQGEFYLNEFLPQYERSFGGKPTAAFHAHAFDATRILFEAIEDVGIRQADGGVVIPRTALKNAIFRTRDFQGLTGTITCNPLGDCGAAVAIAVYEIPKDPWVGGETVVKPAFSQLLTLEEVS